MTNIQETLTQRGKTHGKFEVHAEVTQRMKTLIVSHCNLEQPTRNYIMDEALDMIAHKIGRIVAGNPYTKDHWVDIAGYATLVANTLEEPANV
jgi:poly-gamma-glutamate capsule biosynthesis protein CapA/YwtB (metallophosphatase superfamily)